MIPKAKEALKQKFLAALLTAADKAPVVDKSLTARQLVANGRQMALPGLFDEAPADSVVDKKLALADLSEDQVDVYNQMIQWCNERPSNLLTVGGFAGVGKSTLLGVFAAQTKLLVAYVTFTGRASSGLQRKLAAAGCKTTTYVKPPEALEEGENPLPNFYDFTLTNSRSGPAFGAVVSQLV